MRPLRSLVRVLLATLVVPLNAAPPGLWAYHGPEGALVWSFSDRDDGTMAGTLVHRDGVSPGSPYLCLNAQYRDRPLIGGTWIWGLRPRDSGLWTGGTAVDVRNDQGNLFYCELREAPDGRTLELRSVSGLDPEDRVMVLTRWAEPTKKGLTVAADLWAENPFTQPTATPRPILDPVADRLVATSVQTAAWLGIVGLTLAALFGAR